MSGPPGSGKSTIALHLAKYYGFKYYEGDCFFFEHRNPYIPLDVEDTFNAMFKQNYMKVRQQTLLPHSSVQNFDLVVKRG